MYVCRYIFYVRHVICRKKKHCYISKRGFVYFFLRHTQFCLDIFLYIFFFLLRLLQSFQELFGYRKNIHGPLDDFEQNSCLYSCFSHLKMRAIKLSLFVKHMSVCTPARVESICITGITTWLTHSFTSLGNTAVPASHCQRHIKFC